MADELNGQDEPTEGGASGSGEETDAPKQSPVSSKRPVIKKRRSRKERHEDLAQPDEFVEVGGTIVDWLIERGKVVSIILGVLLLALMVGGIQRKLTSSTQAEAAAALFKAKELLPATTSTPLSGGLSFDLPDTLDDSERKSKVEAAVTAFEAVTKDFSGTPQASQARVLAGQALFGLGEYERALVFAAAAAEAKGIAGERAQNLQGFALLALNRAAEAAEVFSDLRDDTTGASRARATMNLGSAHEAAGDVEAARGVYTLFIEEFPDSELLSEVKSRAGQDASP